jgi:hypothetical protein
MKQIISKIAIPMAALVMSAMPVFADELGSRMPDQGQPVQKDECLLVSKNCSDNVDSIQQRIQRLSHEIGKGTAVYTRDELRRLNYQLQEENKLLHDITTSGGG